MNPERAQYILAELRECKDPRVLEERFGLFDNFPVLLYGDLIPTYEKILDAVINSPKEDGLNQKWTLFDGPERLEAIRRFLRQGRIIEEPTFDFELGTVRALMARTEDIRFYHQPQYCLDGERPVLTITFHPYNDKWMEGVHQNIAMGMGVSDFTQYLVGNGIQNKLIKWEGPDKTV